MWLLFQLLNCIIKFTYVKIILNLTLDPPWLHIPNMNVSHQNLFCFSFYQLSFIKEYPRFAFSICPYQIRDNNYIIWVDMLNYSKIPFEVVSSNQTAAIYSPTTKTFVFSISFLNKSVIVNPCNTLFKSVNVILLLILHYLNKKGGYQHTLLHQGQHDFFKIWIMHETLSL